MDLSSLDGNNGFRLDGATALERTGVSISGAGDVNGDGYDDLIIGSLSRNNYDYGASPITPGFVVFGKASGFDPTVSLSSLDGSNGFHVDIFSSTGLAQAKSVSGAGDHVVGLSQDWKDGGIHGNYHTYTSGEAVLLTTDFV